MNPKDRFKKFLPTPEKVKQNKALKFLGTLLHDPNIWHINRRSIAGGVAIGFFFAWYPMPFQMLCASLVAIWLRKNLPLAIISTLITNPLTMPPFYFFAYWLGNKLLGLGDVSPPEGSVEIQMSFEWLWTQLGTIWQPLLFGCVVMSIVCSFLGYVLMRIFWRFLVIQRMKQRALKRGNHL